MNPVRREFSITELSALAHALGRLGDTAGMPLKACYRLAKFTTKVKTELEAFENARLKLIKELGEPAGERGSWKVKAEHEESFREQVTAMADEKVTIEYVQIPVRDLGDAGLKTLTPNMLVILEALLVPEEEVSDVDV